MADELAQAPDCPSETAYIWHWFLDLAHSRQSGMGLNPISYTDLWSYFQLHGIRPYWWELKALQLLDLTFINTRDDQPKVVDSSRGLFNQDKESRPT